MADENNEDDSWLYGSSNENQDHRDEQQEPQIDENIITNEENDQKDNESSGNDKYDPDDQQVSDINSQNWKILSYLRGSFSITTTSINFKSFTL